MDILAEKASGLVGLTVRGNGFVDGEPVQIPSGRSLEASQALTTPLSCLVASYAQSARQAWPDREVRRAEGR